MSWAPFNSVINSHDITNEIINVGERIKKPEYTEEQIEELEYKIIDAYNTQENIVIKYYKNYKENIISGIITKIDSIKKTIILNNNTNIYFFNILDISQKNTC